MKLENVGISNMAGNNWVVDKSKSNIRFKVRHLLISSVQGEFKDFDLDFEKNGDSFADAHFNLVVKTRSISTRIKQRDQHLKSRDFLDVENYPEIAFKSGYIRKIKNDNYSVKGILQVKGVEKEMELTARMHKMDLRNSYGNFSFELNINRADFDINWSGSLGSKWPLVDETIKIYGNFYVLDKVKGDRIKGLAGRSHTTASTDYQVYTSRTGKLNGSLSWNKISGSVAHWILGNCTGTSEETHYRALRTKLHIENIAREYDHVIHPAQFLRILHYYTLKDDFLTDSLYDKDTYSLDAAYLMVDKSRSTLTYASARLTAILVRKEGMKLLPRNYISLGYRFYNVGRLTDHTVAYEKGDYLILANDELLKQTGGKQGRQLGMKSLGKLLKENMAQPEDIRMVHLEKMLKNWAGKKQMEDIFVAQVKL